MEFIDVLFLPKCEEFVSRVDGGSDSFGEVLQPRGLKQLVMEAQRE